MKVFISWSGPHGQAVAEVLREWLKLAYQHSEPFMSSRDVDAGSRWQSEVAQELNSADFGIICVTSSSQESRWLNFEAGAISKSIDASRVVPIAVDIAVSDIKNPLAQFQGQPLNKGGIRRLLLAMDRVVDVPLGEAAIARLCEVWWPKLEDDLNDISGDVAPAPPSQRSDRELIEESLAILRDMSRRVNKEASTSNDSDSVVEFLAAWHAVRRIRHAEELIERHAGVDEESSTPEISPAALPFLSVDRDFD